MKNKLFEHEMSIFIFVYFCAVLTIEKLSARVVQGPLTL